MPITIKSWAARDSLAVPGKIFRSEFHCEQIYFDTNLFEEMLEKLNMFYFNFDLPASVEWFVSENV